MLKHLLVTLDGSENAEKVIPWVKQYAARETAQVELLQVIRRSEFAYGTRAEALAETQEYLQRIERELNYAGIPCKTLVRIGDPAQVIVRVAEREGSDLILMSSRGGSPMKRWAIGGVTEQVLRMSPIPVLVIQSQTILPRQGHVRRIIVPLDGSRRAETAVPWAGKLAKLLKAQVIFLHVSPTAAAGTKAPTDGNGDGLKQRIAEEVHDLKELGVRAAYNVQRGDPADRILAFSDRNDLIVTTTHGRGGVKRWVFGSVAEKVIHHSTIPVLVYRTA
jgi:nucleotide-binding universal stress UspA family protein